jgi:hypothetical protein
MNTRGCQWGRRNADRDPKSSSKRKWTSDVPVICCVILVVALIVAWVDLLTVKYCACWNQTRPWLWGHPWGHNPPKPRTQMQSGADAGSHRRRNCSDLQNHADRRRRPDRFSRPVPSTTRPPIQVLRSAKLRWLPPHPTTRVGPAVLGSPFDSAPTTQRRACAVQGT